MKKVKVEISAEIELRYDENSQEFKDAFEAYRTMIEDTDDPNDMLQNIASMVATYGCDQLIEGVGYVSINGKKQKDYFHGEVKEKSWCGVDVVGDISYNDTILYDVELINEEEEQ